MRKFLVAIFFLAWHCVFAIDNRSTIFLQPNTTQLFTELYQEYGLQNLKPRTFFEEALYLDQSIPPTKVPLQPSNAAIFDHSNAVLTEFHRRMGDLELYVEPGQNPFFYTAVGSKQLIVALVYGIVMSEPNKKFLFVEQSPFYSGHPNAVNGIFPYPNARFLAFHDPAEIKLEPGEVLVEFVTSPNNPDGKFRKPLSNANILIADFVFASPSFGSDGTGYLENNIAWVRKARKEGKTVFSFNSASKQFGKTGTRCGYIWYPMYNPYALSIFNKFFGFISASTVAGGSMGLADFLDLIKALLDLPDDGKSLREDARKSLEARHMLVEKEFLKRYPGSLVLSIPGSPTFFAKVQDSRIPSKTAADVLLEDLAVSVNTGTPMGEDDTFVRLNLSGYSDILVEFLNRLARKDAYTVADVLFSSVQECSDLIVLSEAGQQTVYAVRPGDCMVNVDASKGPVQIRLVPWIGYLGSGVLTVRKTDLSKYPVAIIGEDIDITLTKQGDRGELHWTQPLYLNGRWIKLER